MRIRMISLAVVFVAACATTVADPTVGGEEPDNTMEDAVEGPVITGHVGEDASLLAEVGLLGSLELEVDADTALALSMDLEAIGEASIDADGDFELELTGELPAIVMAFGSSGEMIAAAIATENHVELGLESSLEVETLLEVPNADIECLMDTVDGETMDDTNRLLGGLLDGESLEWVMDGLNDLVEDLVAAVTEDCL